jgi:hypothetical protein
MVIQHSVVDLNLNNIRREATITPRNASVDPLAFGEVGGV